MPIFIVYLLFLTAATHALSAADPAPAPSAPLGAAEFRASGERPFGWRGDGSGRFPGATPVTHWSAMKNVRWRTVVGRSYSSPIVNEQFVVVTSEPNLVICLNRADGSVRWKFAVTPALLTDPLSRKSAADYESPKHGSGLTAATPVTDGRTVYAVFANGLIGALTLEGQRKWITHIAAEPNTGYGRSASPLLVAGKLIVHMTHLHAFDPATGAQLWINTEARSSYGTPATLKLGNTNLIVTPLGDVVRASDGQSVNGGIAHTSHSSPILGGDGILYFGDLTVSAFRLNSVLKEEEAWNGMVSGDVFGSPLLHDHTLFVTTGDGELFAFDTKGKGTLEPLISGRALFPKGTAGNPVAYASLTLAGNYLFLTSNHGETVVLEATPTARLVSRNRLPAGSGASPVFSGKDLFHRAADKLFCIGE
jgi:outer membrane protein assembly factor BamB